MKAVLLIAFSTAALAQDEFFPKIEGTYLLLTPALLDPGPDSKIDRVMFSIEGKTAREMYDAMDVKPRQYSCHPSIPKLLTKKAGNLECSVDEKGEYSCYIGIMLKTGKTTEGYVCD